MLFIGPIVKKLRFEKWLIRLKSCWYWFLFFFFQPQDANFHGQEQVYGDLGEEMLEHAFEGDKKSRAFIRSLCDRMVQRISALFLEFNGIVLLWWFGAKIVDISSTLANMKLNTFFFFLFLIRVVQDIDDKIRTLRNVWRRGAACKLHPIISTYWSTCINESY